MNTSNDFSFIAFITLLITIAMGIVYSIGSAGSDYYGTSINKSSTFKNETLTMMDAAQNMYVELSMDNSVSSKYFVSDTNEKYMGMCVTLKGLVENGYLDKDISNYGGVFLVEVPKDYGSTKFMAWVHDSKMGINGIEKNYINRLEEDFTDDRSYDEISGGDKALTDNLTGIRKIVDSANKGTITIESKGIKGGTDKVYNNITCINGRLLDF